MILLHLREMYLKLLSANFVWSRVTLNRGLFPTDGSSTSVSLMTTLPFSDLNYYRASHSTKNISSLLDLVILVFGFSGELGLYGCIWRLQRKHHSFKIFMQVAQDL